MQARVTLSLSGTVTVITKNEYTQVTHSINNQMYIKKLMSQTTYGNLTVYEEGSLFQAYIINQACAFLKLPSSAKLVAIHMYVSVSLVYLKKYVRYLYDKVVRIVRDHGRDTLGLSGLRQCHFCNTNSSYFIEFHVFR